MANVQITDLASLTNPATDDVLPVVDVNENLTKKVSVGEILGKISGDVDVATNGASSIAAGAIIDADVNPSAAIAGTKIDPDFGSQTIETTGDLAINTDVLFVDSSESAVGIGTTNPSSLLTLRQTAASHQIIEISRPNSDTGALYLGNDSSENAVISANNKDILFGKDVNGTFNEAARIDSSGKFIVKGVGTEAFSVDGGAPNNSLIIDSSGRCLVGTSTARGVGSLTLPLSLYESTSHTILAVVANSPSGGTLCLGGTGSSSIGSNTLVSNNQTVGGIRFAGADGDDLLSPCASISAQIDGTPGADDMPGRLVFSTNGGSPDTSPTERMTISRNGQTKITGTFNTTAVNGTLAINTDSSGNFFYPRGYSVGTTGGVALYIQSDGRLGPNTSSERYKTSINDLSDIQWLKDLRPVSFFYKDEDGQAAGDQKFGLIAEEVDKVNPDLVFRPNGTIESVHYDQLIAPLITAYQQAIRRIEQLEAKVNALEGN